MGYYLHVGPRHEFHWVWSIDSHQARRVDVMGDATGPYHFEAERGEHPLEIIRRKCPDWFRSSPQSKGLMPTGEVFVPLRLQPGEIWAGVARPTLRDGSLNALEYPNHFETRIERSLSFNQALLLKRELEEVCRTIHPEGANLDAYGPRIRGLLMQACADLEAHFVDLLSQHRFDGKPPQERPRWTMNDYISLAPVLGLREWQITFLTYEWLDFFSPFSEWETACPAKSLSWWDAYAEAKHAGVDARSAAKLRHAFSAVAACYAVIVARYGISHVERAASELAGFVAPIGFPDSALSETYYSLGPIHSWEWHAVPHPDLKRNRQREGGSRKGRGESRTR